MSTDAPHAARRPRGRGDRRKWLQVRVSEEEHALIEQRARDAGFTSISEYARDRLLRDLEPSLTTEEATPSG